VNFLPEHFARPRVVNDHVCQIRLERRRLQDLEHPYLWRARRSTLFAKDYSVVLDEAVVTDKE
jgi:hypothetical protein